MIMVVMLVMGGLSYVNLLTVTAQNPNAHHIHFEVEKVSSL
jgi:hypothetical protein